MSRIKLDLPASPALVTITIPVRITDINYGNHVGNDAFVSIIHEARLQWLKHHGYSEMSIEGTALIMSDLALEFKSEAYYGDTIGVEIFTGEQTRVGFELYYKLEVNRNGQNILVAKAKTGMVCFNYELRKTVSLPDAVKRLLNTPH